jgi:asparagine synthase (glutamine-hydrolysing)
MCGIAGIFSYRRNEEADHDAMERALSCMIRRGPDFRQVVTNGPVSLGHSRLSIIDTSADANQPLTDTQHRYKLVYNGEIFNFPELKKELEKKGIQFKTRSDSEVLFHLLITEGKNALKKLRGFFAFAFYDRDNHTLLLARDRMGEKPVFWTEESNRFYFASELKSLLEFPVSKIPDPSLLEVYFSLNYLPGPSTLLKNIFQLEPGTLLEISGNGIRHETWYQPAHGKIQSDYQNAKKDLHEILEESVRIRLISDVPVGSFLSGGIDSTIITGLAKKFKPDLRSFSIGFPEDKFFDETPFALDAAKHIGTDHEVINITGKEMEDSIDDVLNYLDHPFADSSCIPFYLLCKKVKSELTVALSGDGADELFGGYNKHRAWMRSLKKNISNSLLRVSGGLFAGIPDQRHSSYSNKLRQVKRYSKGLKLDPASRYLHWAGFTDSGFLKGFFHPSLQVTDPAKHLHPFLPATDELNDVLLSDIRMVLANDMLVKVDRMSMANSMEIRPPFLDHEVVSFALSTPSSWKTNTSKGKIILRDTFADLLPPSIHNRPKRGFEVPLQRWLETTLAPRIHDEWLNDTYIREQGIFNPAAISELKKNISTKKANPHTVWALIVFQHWWKKYIT